MAARLVRPLYLRLGVRTSKVEKAHPPDASNTDGGAPRILPVGGSAAVPPSAKNSDDGSIRVQRDDVRDIQERKEPFFSLLLSSDTDSFEFQRDNRAIAEQRTEAPPSPPLKNSDHGSLKVGRDGKAGTDEYARAPLTLQAEPSDNVSINVVRNDQAVVEERSEPSLSPPPKSSDYAAAEVRRNDKLVIEELEREQRFAYGPPRNRRNPNDERLSTGTIIPIAAAVIVLGLGFTALLPSVLTRDLVEPAVTLTTSPPPQFAEPVQTDQVGAVQPVPAPTPAQPPQVVQPVPTPDDVASVAKTAPALQGSSASQEQGEGRALEEVLVPSAGEAAGRTSLTAAEKAAVTRGLQELEKKAVVATTPRRPAPTRPQLTAEEKAAVERGLRELEKTAAPATP